MSSRARASGVAVACSPDLPSHPSQSGPIPFGLSATSRIIRYIRYIPQDQSVHLVRAPLFAVPFRERLGLAGGKPPQQVRPPTRLRSGGAKAGAWFVGGVLAIRCRSGAPGCR